MPEQSSQYVPTENGCFIDKSRIWLGADGAIEHLEWTPTLNPDERLSFKKAVALGDSCELNGGGWHTPDPHELQSLVNYEKFNPASDAPGTLSDWYWTRQVDPSSPSDLAFYVSFYDGYVSWGGQDSYGRVRACRRVRASQ